MIILVLIAASKVTSAEIREKSEDILKPQFQPYYECDRDKMTNNNEILAKQKAMKSSRALRRLGKILQYKFQINDPILLFPDDINELVNSSKLEEDVKSLNRSSLLPHAGKISFDFRGQRNDS